ncbi:MAG: O-antigen ligase family protein [Bacillota bacterium]
MRKSLLLLYILVFASFTDLTTFTMEKFGIPAAPILFLLAAGVLLFEMSTSESYPLLSCRDPRTYVVTAFFLVYLTMGSIHADLGEAYYDIYMLLIGYFIFQLVSLSVRSREELDGILLTILLCAPVLTLQGVYEFYLAVLSGGFEGYFRAGGWWPGPNEYAFVMCLVYLTSFYFLGRDEKTLRGAGYLSQLCACAGILLSLSRGGLLTFLLISLLHWRIFWRRKGYLAVSLLLVVVVYLVVFANVFNVEVFNSIPAERLFISSGLEGSDFSNGRFQAAIGGLLIYAQHPLTGVGFGNILVYADAINYYKTYSHNMFIEIMAVTGTLPLLFYLFMLGYLWHTAPKSAGADGAMERMLRGYIVVIVAMGIFAHYLLLMKPLWILLAFFPAHSQLRNKREPGNQHY